MPKHNEVVHDDKENASFSFSQVIEATVGNFPDSRYQPRVRRRTGPYVFNGIDPSPHILRETGDGTGTKPELAERLYAEDGDPTWFSTIAFDASAMVKGDAERVGHFFLGLTETLDVNSAANTVVMNALARGLKNAADEGRFAILNGETAELGHRTSGYGDFHMNWNAVGTNLVVATKEITGEKLAAGQPLVAFREKGLRSNGFSLARKILETAHLHSIGYSNKASYFVDQLRKQGIVGEQAQLIKHLNEVFGHDTLEQVLLPWQRTFPEITQQLLAPSSLYGSIMYDAQGGVDGEPKVNITAAAHITGGGIPLKTTRMVESSGLGVSLDAVFPQPIALSSLLSLIANLPEGLQAELKVTPRKAAETWNSGIGFVVATATLGDADTLIHIAEAGGYEAKLAGEVTDRPEVQLNDMVWKY